MFVYRDSGDDQRDYPEPDPTAAAQREAEYWYGPAEMAFVEPEPAGTVRGPFEPLIHVDPGPDTAGVVTDAAGTQGTRDGGSETDEPDEQQARKLEQIKDFYLTAEAIGEQNIDKHFDELLAHQRELISDYFKQSAARRGEPGKEEPGRDGTGGYQSGGYEPGRAGAEPTQASVPGLP